MMNQFEMEYLIEVFENSTTPIYSVWDTSTDDKVLLCASSDVKIVYACILESRLSTKEQKDAVMNAVNELTQNEKFYAPSFMMRYECGSGVCLPSSVQKVLGLRQKCTLGKS